MNAVLGAGVGTDPTARTSTQLSTPAIGGGPTPDVPFRTILAQVKKAAANTSMTPANPAAPAVSALPTRSFPIAPTASAQVKPRSTTLVGDEVDTHSAERRRASSLAHPYSLESAPAGVFLPFPIVAAPPAVTENAGARASLEELIPALVRRIAWSGDRYRGSVRVEIGSGELSGATLLVHAEYGRVRVQMDVPPGVDAHHWQQRIEAQLASRGVATDSVEVS